jgi:non-specific serine/threonine protein kinase/serine/threonine-protein kinase
MNEGIDWHAVDDVFHAAVVLPAADRPSCVAARCQGRPDVEQEVLSLLAAHDASGGFLEPLVAQPVDAGAAVVGSRIGPYRLARLLGHGGMGTVYLADRVDGAFSQRVAIKLTRAVLDVEVTRRFAAEREILAALHHPNVVTLFDGGTTETGQAFLVMEYVEGQPVADYVRNRRVGLQERLRLFQQVCAGVHAAHQHGAVHRDLKPANVLVTREGVVKVLDFGVAKLVGAPSRDSTVTAAPLTPNYASPEQLRGEPVTISSDVYSLGVMLYELASGTRPYDSDNQPLDVVLAQVLHNRTRRPSAAGLPPDLPYDRSALRGDLDAVVLKAMRVEAEERYGGAAALSDDLGRVLAGHPVTVREPSFGYLARKLVSRHRAAATVAGLAMVAIVGSLVMALWQSRRAEAERSAAQARFDDVRQLATALIFKLDEAIRLKSPTEARRVVVEEALGYLNRLASVSDDPRVRLELAQGYTRIGEVQGHPGFPNLGDREGARSSFARAIDLVTPIEALPAHRGRALAVLVGAHRLIASVQSESSARTESIRAAVAAAERWVALERSDAARRALGSALFALASSAGWPAGRPHWEAAGREFEALLADQPEDPDRMRNVALVDKYLTQRLSESGETAEARRRADRAATFDLCRRGKG